MMTRANYPCRQTIWPWNITNMTFFVKCISLNSHAEPTVQTGEAWERVVPGQDSPQSDFGSMKVFLSPTKLLLAPTKLLLAPTTKNVVKCFMCKLLYFNECWFCWEKSCKRRVFPFIYCSVLVLGHRKQLGGGNNPGPPGMSWAEIIPPLPNYVHLPRIPKRLFPRPNNPNVATVNWESNNFYQRTKDFFLQNNSFPIFGYPKRTFRFSESVIFVTYQRLVSVISITASQQHWGPF